MKIRIIALSIIVSTLFINAQEANSQTTSSSIKSLSSKYDAEIDKLISKMTLEEKIGILHGNSMFSTGAVKRLGIPELKMADGPLGVREEISRNNWAPAGLTNDFAT